MPNHRVSTRLFVVALVCVGIFNCDRAPAEVNVPGKPETWFGSATREDIGHVVDNVDMAPDPLKTFEAHDGKRFSYEGERQPSQGRAFTLKTPKPGRYVFAYGVQTGKGGGVAVRYRSGDKWVQLPPGQIQPDYFRGWDSREFCYWVHIPEGQTTTRFEISGPARGALIAEPRKDPFEGMPGGKHPMFELPSVEKIGRTEVGRAILDAFGSDPTTPLSDEAFEKRMQSLEPYEKMSYYHHVNYGKAWSIAADGLRYRISGDKKYARLAGEKGARIAKWPTWGFVQEWNVDMARWAAPGHERQKNRGPFVRNHTLKETNMIEGMATGYDLACDGMSPEHRQAFRKALDHHAHLMYVRSLLSPWNLYHHSNWSGHLQATLALAAAALWGEDRYAAEWMARFKAAVPHYLSDLLDPNGVHRETLSYSCFGLNPLSLAGIAAQRKGAASLFEIADGRLDKFLLTIVHFLSPNGQAIRDFGQTGGNLQTTTTGGLGKRVATMVVAMTHSSRGDLARWACGRALHRFSTRKGEKRLLNAQQPILNLLLFKPGRAKAPGDFGLPLGWHARSPVSYPYDNGYVVMRTGFDSPDDIKMLIKCGNAQGAHGQPCQGSFILDAYGDLLSQSPGYNIWGGKTRSHNVITIDGKGQAQGHHMGSGRKENDGHVERFVHSPHADVCIVNNKPAYDGGKNPVARSLRYVLFVRKPERRGYFVIVDDVDKDGKEHEYTWHFHSSFDHRITADGERGFVAKGITKAQALQLWSERGEEGIVKSLDKTRPSNTLGGAWPGPTDRKPWIKEKLVDLRLAFVSPESFTHKITFKGADWKKDIAIPDHLQVTAKAAAPVFFVLLYPERKDLGVEMPTVEAIRGDGVTGAKVGDDLILFARRNGV